MSNLNKILIGLSVIIAIVLAAMSVIIFTRKKERQAQVSQIAQTPVTTQETSEGRIETIPTNPVTGTQTITIPSTIPRGSTIAIDEKGIQIPFETVPPGIPVVIKNYSRANLAVTIRSSKGNQNLTLKPNEQYLFSETKGDVTIEVPISGVSKKTTFKIDDRIPMN